MRTVTVGMGDTATGGMGHTVTVGMGHTVTVGMGHTVTRGMRHMVTVSMGHTVTVGMGHTLTGASWGTWVLLPFPFTSNSHRRRARLLRRACSCGRKEANVWTIFKRIKEEKKDDD